MKAERIIIIGGPRRGKSTLAASLASGVLVGPSRLSAPIRCGDPLSMVKDPMPGVEYLPEGIPFAGDYGAAQWIAEHWFTRPGPWVCEGHVMARALRRWVATYQADGMYRGQPQYPADRIIVLDRPAWVESSARQEAMHKAVMTVWYGNPEKDIPGICHHFDAITDDPSFHGSGGVD